MDLGKKSVTEERERNQVAHHQVFRRDLIMKIGYDELGVQCISGTVDWCNCVVSFRRGQGCTVMKPSTIGASRTL